MRDKKLFKKLVNLIILIFILNFCAGKFYWYSSIWWSDMPMHFLGGIWLGLVFLWFFSSKDNSSPVSWLNGRKSQFEFIVPILFGVLMVGICWEVFELYFVNYVGQNSFNMTDTVSDIFFDLAGGMLAIVYYIKKHTNNISIVQASLNKVQ